MQISDVINDVKVNGLEDAIRGAKYPYATDVSKLTSEPKPITKILWSSGIGEGHDQSLTGINVQFDLTFTIKAWTEAERYHFLEFVSSTSTMHKITKFDLDKSYNEYVSPEAIAIMKRLVDEYNNLEDKDERNQKYLEILYTNPCGFKLTARMTTNYRQLKTIYYQRRAHRLPEWRVFCKWIETLPMFKEYILKNDSEYDYSEKHNTSEDNNNG